MKLICETCGNNKTLTTECLYAYEVDNEDNKIGPEEVVDKPEYCCTECGSGDSQLICEDPL